MRLKELISYPNKGTEKMPLLFLFEIIKEKVSAKISLLQISPKLSPALLHISGLLGGYPSVVWLLYLSPGYGILCAEIQTAHGPIIVKEEHYPNIDNLPPQKCTCENATVAFSSSERKRSSKATFKFAAQ